MIQIISTSKSSLRLLYFCVQAWSCRVGRLTMVCWGFCVSGFWLYGVRYSQLGQSLGRLSETRRTGSRKQPPNAATNLLYSFGAFWSARFSQFRLPQSLKADTDMQSKSVCLLFVLVICTPRPSASPEPSSAFRSLKTR